MSLPTQSNHGVTFYEACPATPKNEFAYLLLHGLGDTLNFWVEVAPVLGEARRTIAIDIPGFGGSPVPVGGFTLDQISQAIESFIEAVDLDRCVLVAHSFGSFVGLRLAALAQQRFLRLILVDGTLTRTVELIQQPRKVLSDPSLELYVAAQFVGGLVPICGRMAEILAHSSILRSLTLWPYVADPNGLSPKTLTDALTGNGSATVLKVLRQAGRLDYRRLMSAVTQPVDIVWGADDHLIDQRDIQSARDLMRIDRELEIINCGHWPMIERPAALTEFLLLQDASAG